MATSPLTDARLADLRTAAENVLASYHGARGAVVLHVRADELLALVEECEAFRQFDREIFGQLMARVNERNTTS